jgi:subtilisin-like proprotein convertase family protein
MNPGECLVIILRPLGLPIPRFWRRTADKGRRTRLYRPAIELLERREVPSGMNFVSNFNNGTTPYSDVWGEGNYAYIGHLQQQGVDIVDITNPASPKLASVFMGTGGTNNVRDLEVQNNIAFFGAGDPSGGSVYVVDVHDPYHPVQLANISLTPSGLTGIHSLGVGGNYLYVCDSNDNKVGVWDISTPSSPLFVRTILSPKAPNIHEVTPIGGRLYTASLDAVGYVDIWDISNVGNTSIPVPLLCEFVAGQAAHTAWPTDDGNYVTVSHEINGGTEAIWDIHDLSHPFLASIIPDLPRSQAFAGHQQMIKGNLLYSSWYQAGAQVFDISDPRNPVFVGSYDTYPQPVTDKIQGDWGIYGFLGNDRILASDISTGLYVLSLPNISIQGQVYRDTNGNGQQDSGEAGISGRFVYLDTNNNGAFDPGEPHTFTDANGNYSFQNLPPGAYRVRTLSPGGWVQTTANPAAISGGLNGTNVTGINFGSFQRETLSGLVFNDANSSGMQDPGETGVAGQIVFLDQNNDGVLGTDQTVVHAQDIPKAIPEQGTISSTLFARGFIGPIKKLTVTLNIAHTFDGDLEMVLISPNGTQVPLITHRGTSGQNFTGTILDDAASTPISAGTAPFSNTYRPEQPLSAFVGKNPNGVWTLRVTDTNLFDSGTVLGWSINFTTSEPAVRTDANGNFTFAGLPPATYSVRLALPPGRAQTTPVLPAIPPTSGANITGLTFGTVLQNSISGQVFQDANDNGKQDPGEPGFSGVTVYLDQNNDGILDTDSATVSSPNVPVPIPDVGNASSNLTANGFVGAIADVNVHLDIQHTFDRDLAVTLISPSGSQVLLINHRGGSGHNFTGTILDDQAATPISAGTAPFTGSFQPEQPLAALNGQSANGVWTLQINDDEQFDTGTLLDWSLTFTTTEPSTQTDANGKYTFAGLPRGTYTVREITPAGWVQTTSNPGPINMTGNGTNVTGILFGDFHSGAITGPVVSANSAPAPETTPVPQTSPAGWVVFMDPKKAGMLDPGAHTLITNSRAHQLFNRERPYGIPEAGLASWTE